ncbi:MAG: hypothetical protein ACP5G1_04265 [Nanopusillaceae archaeon]
MVDQEQYMINVEPNSIILDLTHDNIYRLKFDLGEVEIERKKYKVIGELETDNLEELTEIYNSISNRQSVPIQLSKYEAFWKIFYNDIDEEVNIKLSKENIMLYDGKNNYKNISLEKIDRYK